MQERIAALEAENAAFKISLKEINDRICALETNNRNAINKKQSEAIDKTTQVISEYITQNLSSYTAAIGKTTDAITQVLSVYGSLQNPSHEAPE